MFPALRKLQPAAGFLSGVLIGLAIVTPVFGATSPGLERWNGAFALIALVLLVIGLAWNAAMASRAARRAITPMRR